MDFFSIWHLVILLLIVVVLFGTSKLKHIGTDLGSAIKSFKSAMNDEQAGASNPKTEKGKPNVPAITRQEADGQAADRTEAEHTDGQKTRD